jgi:hypothetical protein
MWIETTTLAATVVSATATIGLVYVGYRQLNALIRQIELQGLRDRKAHTLAALENYIRDPNVTALSRRIWEKSAGGTNYASFREVDHDVILSLNYLEGFATAVLQGVYDEKMVRDFLEPLIYKAVKVFLRGESGEYMGTTWIAGKSMFTEQEYQNLIAVFRCWWPASPAITFKDEAQ